MIIKNSSDKKCAIAVALQYTPFAYDIFFY